MKISDIFEAGEPSNPSRRGFLKKAAAVGATAATNPSSLLKGAGGLASTAGSIAGNVATPIARALANPMALESKLVAACASWIAKHSLESVEMRWNQKTTPIKDYEQNWRPGENDMGFSLTKPDNKDIKTAKGAMPWGEDYDFSITPGGLPYLRTSTDGLHDEVFTYVDTDGNIETFDWTYDERQRYERREGLPRGEDALTHNDFGRIVDYHEAGMRQWKEQESRREKMKAEREAQKKDAQPTATEPTKNTSSIGNLASSLAKRALFTKLGKELVGTNTPSNTTDEPVDTSNLPHADGIDKTPELPAPDEPNELLTPDLQRMKDLAGVKRKEEN